MSVEWVGAKPGIFINNSVVTPIDADNMNSIVNTVDKIAVGGAVSGLDAATITGKTLDALITPSDEGLVAFYSFDAINGDATQDLDDDSGNGQYGTLYNGVSEKGVIGKAISFNGTNAYAKGTYPNISQLTISLWYKGTNTGVNEPLFLLKKASNATKLGVYVDEGYALCSFTDADNVVQELSGCLINNNVYHQITITHNGSKCSVYCDGQLASSAFLSLTTLYYNEWLLCVNEALSSFTAASIDDVRVYNRVLSANEIYGQYITKISTKVPSKTPYYTADEITLVDQKHSVIDNTSRVAEYTGDGGGATIKDRAGNGNNLTATDITYVNGKYGKEMSFNGSSSYAQASSPVIGTTGTVAVRFKINSAATTGEVASNTNKDTLNGFRLRVALGGSLNAFIAGSSTAQNISLGTIGLVSYNTIVISYDGTTVTKTVAGVTTTEAQTVTMTSALFNLTLGWFAQAATNYFNGIISHFRYDSRIWTADEARAWSLNPISIDSRV